MSAAAGLGEVDYRNAERSCDIVMKGGITSGVVYPHAVCELAGTYRFRNVGGTSAGAIAAAATAAAEYGRQRRGFEKLAALPEWLGEGHNLRDLFQPEARTRRLHAVLLAAVEGGGGAAARAALRTHPLAAIAGLLAGLAPSAAALGVGVATGATWAIVLAAGVSALVGLPLAIATMAAALAARIGLEANREIADNRFGLCSGGPREGEEERSVKPLTVWLSGELDRYAGLPADEPLTFGHLWAGPDGDRANPPPPPRRHLQLAMMTTNLINRRAHQLPWDDHVWFFKPAELRRLFPEYVVRWMESHSRDKLDSDCATKGERGSRVRLALAREQGFLPLPDAADLPVLVATRMSLAFPVLLSAVPLWRIDMTREDNAVLYGWERWAGEQPDGWDPLAAPRAAWPAEGQPAGEPEIECCWFSDGGISSNFPVHFFDRLVPRWPTFAINLRPFGYGKRRDEDEAGNTWMVTSNNEGWKEWWYRLPQRQPAAHRDRRLGAFLSAVVRTMQNRVDEAQMRVPGFRDRVAHVSMSDDEGGMNLAMPAPRIAALTERGRAAARRLVDAYAPPDGDGQDITWDNHRWVRLRSALAVLEEMNRAFADGYMKPPVTPGEPTYPELLEDPPSYPLDTAWQRKLAEGHIEAIEAALAALEEASGGASTQRSMAHGAPSPQPQGRIMPRD